MQYVEYMLKGRSVNVPQFKMYLKGMNSDQRDETQWKELPSQT